MYSRCVHKAAIHCTADVFRRLQYVVYSRCVQKSAIHCVQQMCSEGCNPLCTADVFRSLLSAMFSRCVQKTAIPYWILTSMLVLLIRGSLLWQTSCIAVLLTHSRSRLCGSAVCCTGDRPYVPASLRHLDTPLWDELLFSCFNNACLHADGQGSEHCSVRTPICSERIGELFRERK